MTFRRHRMRTTTSTSLDAGNLTHYRIRRRLHLTPIHLTATANFGSARHSTVVLSSFEASILPTSEAGSSEPGNGSSHFSDVDTAYRIRRIAPEQIARASCRLMADLFIIRGNIAGRQPPASDRRHDAGL